MFCCHDIKDSGTILLSNFEESLIWSHHLPLNLLFEKVAPYMSGKTGPDGLNHLHYFLRLKEPLPIVVVDGKDSLGPERLDVAALIACKKARKAAEAKAKNVIAIKWLRHNHLLLH